MKSILLVDDTSQGLAELAKALANAGYKAVVVPPSDDAVTRFTLAQAELVFVSTEGPNPDSACEGIRAEPDGAIVPIVLVGTPAPGLTNAADALAKGADFFFELPLDTKRVMAKVQTYIGAGSPTSGLNPAELFDDDATVVPGTPPKNLPKPAPAAPSLKRPRGLDDDVTSPGLPTPPRFDDWPQAPTLAGPADALLALVDAPPTPDEAPSEASADVDEIARRVAFEGGDEEESPSAPANEPIAVKAQAPIESDEAMRLRVEREVRERLEQEEAEQNAQREAQEEAERQAREQVERQAREQVERQAQKEAARKEQEETARRQREEAEKRAREEAEKRAREEAEKRARENAEKREREDAERRAKDEAEHRIREQAEARAREEAEKRIREETEKRIREEAETKARAEIERRVKEEAERKAQTELERRAKEEATRQAQEEAERTARAETERQAMEAEIRRKVEAELRQRMDVVAPQAPPRPNDEPKSRASEPLPTQIRPFEPNEAAFDATHDVAAVLFDIAKQGVTGRVDFSSENRQKSVFFERGRPIDAYSSQVYDRMEEYLLREGKITRSQYQDVRVKALRGPRRIGAHLVSEGALKPHELFDAVRGHLAEMIFGLLEWEEGSYRFLAERADEDDKVALEQTPQALITEGIRRKYLMPRLMRRLGGPSSLLRVTAQPADFEILALTVEERHLLRLVDGTRNIEDLVFSTGMDALSVFHVLTALVTLGHADIAVRGIEGAEDGTTTGDPIDKNRIRDKIEQVRNLDYFQILGVPRTATPYEIERAFERTLNEYAPQRFSSLLRSELRSDLVEIEQVLQDARQVLKDEALREAYARHLR